MKGGDTLGINDATLGNLIIALVNFKYYIKCKMNDKIYYFVFDLSKNNNMVNDYGVSKKLIENANQLESLSKALLDLNVSDNEFYKIFTGEVYEEEETQVNGDKIILSKNGGKNATLTIAADKNYVIAYQLNIGEASIGSQILSSSGKLGKNVLGQCSPFIYLQSIETIKKTVRDYNVSKHPKSLQIILELEKETFNCGQEIVSQLNRTEQEKMYDELIDSDNFIFVADQPNIFNSYLYLVEQVGTTIGKTGDELSKIKREIKEKVNIKMTALEGVLKKSSQEGSSSIVNYISSMKYFGKQDFIITGELMNLILNSLGDIVSQEGSEKTLKNVYDVNSKTPVKSSDLSKFIETIFVKLQTRFIDEQLIQERDREIVSQKVYFYLLFVVLSLIEIIKRGSSLQNGVHLLTITQIDMLLNEINKKIDSMSLDSSDESFKTYIDKNSYNNDVNEIVDNYIEAFRTFRESKKNNENQEFLENNGKKGDITDQEKKQKEQDLQQHITAAKDAENKEQDRIKAIAMREAQQKKINGGSKLLNFNPNTVAIIENKSENLNFDEFIEPIIYLKSIGKKSRRDAVQIQTNQDENENAIFPYITIGKPLLLKLTEMLTNQRVSFEKPESSIKSIGKWIANNALFALQFSGLLSTLLSYAGTQYSIDVLKNPEKVQEIAKNLTSIVASQNSTNSTGIFPTASNNDFMTSLPDNTIDKLSSSGIVNLNLGFKPNSTSKLEIGGRKTKKNKKYKKTKKNKKYKNNKTKNKK
jgi:hypothetical protein